MILHRMFEKGSQGPLFSLFFLYRDCGRPLTHGHLFGTSFINDVGRRMDAYGMDESIHVSFVVQISLFLCSFLNPVCQVFVHKTMILWSSPVL